MNAISYTKKRDNSWMGSVSLGDRRIQITFSKWYKMESSVCQTVKAGIMIQILDECTFLCKYISGQYITHKNVLKLNSGQNKC